MAGPRAQGGGEGNQSQARVARSAPGAGSYAGPAAAGTPAAPAKCERHSQQSAGVLRSACRLRNKHAQPMIQQSAEANQAKLEGWGCFHWQCLSHCLSHPELSFEPNQAPLPPRILNAAQFG
eukprot:1159262-Pelagomonas_calceolata.AAC.7